MRDPYLRRPHSVPDSEAVVITTILVGLSPTFTGLLLLLFLLIVIGIFVNADVAISIDNDVQCGR